jgi:O-antigen/teichoic acid export membrane protein
MPLITFPYLIKTLGKEMYGLVIFAQAVISYFQILVSFGFTTSATKEASINRNNKVKLGEIFGSILIVKIILFIISLILLAILLRFIPKLYGYEWLFFISMWICLYDAVFPLWYFLGIEKMKYITFLTLISRIISLVLLFLLVKSPDHYLRVPLINGIGAIIGAIGSIIIIINDNKILLTFPSFLQLKFHFKKSIPYFISELSSNIFINSNKIVLGSLLGMAEVAYYDLADKITSIFRSVPIGIVRNTIYPRVAQTKNMNIVYKTTIIMTGFAIISVLLINFTAPMLITYLGGEEMLGGVNALRIFSIAIITAHISNYYLTVGLWSLDYNIEFRNAMIYTSFIYIGILLLLSIFGWIGLYSLILSIILVDLFQSFYCFYIYKKIKNH